MFFTPEDKASGRPEAELLESLQHGKASVDGWHVRKDGSRLWCTATVQPLRDANGAVTGFTKIVRDSTEQHLMSERLRESEERLRLLVDSVTDYAIISMDIDGKVLSWNSGAQYIFGYPEAEVLGRHFSLLYTAEAIARGVPDTEVATATADGRAADEGWHVRRRGEPFYASGQMMRLKPDLDGRPRGFVKVVHDITARNEADEALRRRAFRDELTDLPNRAFFGDCLRRSIAHASRYPRHRFAVIFLDLDHFKAVNDSLGHVAADGLLIHVARALERCVRPEDVVARLGGDEFTILLSDIRTTADATRVAKRIQTALKAPARLDGIDVYPSASMGIAIGSPTSTTPEQVLHDADTAMYQAKARGRSRHVLFRAEMRASAKRPTIRTDNPVASAELVG